MGNQTELDLYRFLESGCKVAYSIDPSGRLFDDMLSDFENRLLTEMAERYAAENELARRQKAEREAKQKKE